MSEVVLQMNEQDHQLLRQLITQLERVSNDHENRIRFLERYINIVIGGATVVYWLLQQFGK